MYKINAVAYSVVAKPNATQYLAKLQVYIHDNLYKIHGLHAYIHPCKIARQK